MKKFILFVCAVSSAALFAAVPEFDLAFDSANGTTPKDWVLNESIKDDGKTSGAVKIEKGTAGNVLVLTSNKQYAYIYTLSLTPAKAGQTFNASASVSGKGRFAIVLYSYTEKTGNVSEPQVEFLGLTDTPTVQKFSIPIADSNGKVVAKLRAVIGVEPETELKLSDLKISVD